MSDRLGRRLFLELSLSMGAGLVVGCQLEANSPPQARSRAPGEAEHAKAGESTRSRETFNANAWVRIAPDGALTVIVDRSEMGQGVETALPMLVAEELEADWSRVSIAFAPADPPVYKNPAMNLQLTGGSSSIRGSYMPMRKAGAAARMMLVTAAAKTWGVDESTCRAEKGEVMHVPTGRRIGYGDLTAAAAKLPVPQNPALKDPSGFRIVGTRPPRLDAKAKASGRPIFGIDVKLPGMLTAVVVRCPVFRGKAAKFDAAPAMAVQGVRKVFPISTGIAVVADHFWAARQGARALKVDWNEGKNASITSEKLAKDAAAFAKKPGKVAETKGDIDKAFPSAKDKLDAVYEVPFQAHAAMEPSNCTAHVRKDACELWVPTQFQEAVAGAAAKVSGLPLSAIQVHTTYLGGGFGRRAEVDFVIEALEASKQMDAPVKLVWTREDDIRHDFYRPLAYHVLRAGLDKSGSPIAWSHRIVSGSIMSRISPSMVKDGLDHSSVEGAIETHYAIPNVLVDYHLHDSGVPVGFWRSVGHSTNAFVKESFIDELAVLAKQDPYEYRKKLLTGAPRLVGVLDLAASKAGWGKPLAPGKGRGIAAHHSFGSFVAQVAEVTVEKDGHVKVDRVVCAIDCGAVVHPGNVEAQMEGSIVFGLTAALKSSITLAAGRVKQGNFHDFKLLSMDEAPAVEVYIVSSKEAPGGVGEPGTPPIAPAVTNAIFAATGKRVRRLPVLAADLKK
jgi:isoquinoline 1-oxidoreductase beta subunit